MPASLPDIDGLVCSAATANLLDSWIGLAALALVTSAMILGLYYIMATILRSQRHLTFVKLELFEVFVTLLVIISLEAIVASACTVKVGWFFPHSLNQGSTIYNASMNYFSRVENKFETWMHMEYVLNVYIDQMASATPYSRPLGVGLITTPLVGFAAPIKSFLYNVFTAMAIAYVINEAQKYVFVFATYGFMKWYLPIGVFLRSFTPTRRIGGTLIALSLTFVFFLPLLTTIASEIMLGDQGLLIGIEQIVTDLFRQKSSGECEVRDPDDPTRCLQYRELGPIATFFKTLFLPEIDFDDLISGGFLTIVGEWLKSVIGKIIGLILFIPLSTIGMAFMLGYLIPALNVLMLVQITKSFSRTIGEEIDITTLTRMI